MGEVIVRPHSPISGSRIVKFLACPTSFYSTPNDLIDTSPKTAAAEGERAHDLAEKTLLEGEDVLKSCRNKQMREGAKIYADYINSVSTRDCISTESFVHMGDSFGFEDENYIGGYYDAMYYDRNKKILWIFDYKFGFHIVEADTPQLTFYLLAKIIMEAREVFLDLPIWKYEICEHIDTYYKDWVFKQTIVQPKRKDNPIHTVEITAEQLKQFTCDLCDAVEIYQDTDAFDDEYCHANSMCKYCEKRLFCKKSGVRDNEDVAFKFDTLV